MLLGADFGYLMDSGLSFYLNNNVSFLSSGNMVTPSLDNFITSRIAKTKGAFYKGAFYDGQFLVGWTFKNLVYIQKLSSKSSYFYTGWFRFWIWYFHTNPTQNRRGKNGSSKRRTR